jgi:hypothetical protein
MQMGGVSSTASSEPITAHPAAGDPDYDDIPPECRLYQSPCDDTPAEDDERDDYAEHERFMHWLDSQAVRARGQVAV